MAITINAKGTSVPYFKIGKGGTTVYQGALDPSLEYIIETGDIWFDTNSNTVRHRLSTDTWNNVGSTVTVSSTAPLNPSYGELWFDEGDTGKIFIWLGADWVDTSPTPNASVDISGINDVLLTSLSDGQVLSYDAGNSVWVNTIPSSSLLDTDGLTEGSTNLYFTDARARESISVSGDLSYNSTSGVISYTTPSIPSDVSELTDTTNLLVHFSGEYTDLANAPTNVSSFTNDAGYLTSFTETDPVYSASPASGITSGLIGQWNTSYAWGDHALVGYITTETETYSTPTELLTAIKTVDGIGSLLDSDLLDGQEGSYYLNYSNFVNTPTIPSTTDEISEVGSPVNLWFTYERARTAISVAGDLSYNPTSGIIAYSTPTDISAFTNDSGYLTSVGLGDMVDVVISSINVNEVLGYDGTNWVNVATNASDWDQAFAWGDHAIQGYLTSATETYSTPNQLLSDLLTVDGQGSQLDADFWDGNEFSEYMDQGVRTTDNVIFGNAVVGDLTVNGSLYSDDITATDVTIVGNLTVSGTVLTVNSETVNIADNIFLLNSNVTTAPTENAGIEIERGTDVNVMFMWDETLDVWTYGSENVYTAGTATLGQVVTHFGSNQNANLSSVSTDDLPEGINLYYTTARVDSRIAAIETNDYVDSISFNSVDGELTLGRTGSLIDLTTNLDGRYQIAGTYDNYVGWNLSVNSASHGSISSGEVVNFVAGDNVDISYAASSNTITFGSVDTNTYLTEMSFNAGNGVLIATLSDNSITTVDLDGRYSQTDTTYTSGSGITLTGTVFSVNVNTGLEIDINDDIIISSTGVTTGSYGSADSTASFNVNSSGQITSASNLPISIVASQVSDFNDGVKAAMAMTHSGIYVVSASDETTNMSANMPITANTLGFNLAAKEIYMVYLNRLLLRPSEYTLDSGTGTIIFQQTLLAQNDEIEAVYYG